MNRRGHRIHDRMVVRFTTTYAVSAYHHWCCEFESRTSTNKTYHHDYGYNWNIVESAVNHHKTNQSQPSMIRGERWLFIFFSYWLNCWQSLFKLSFHNVYDIATMYTLFTTWLADWFQISIPSTPSLPSSWYMYMLVLFKNQNLLP